jgi:Lrp/AsnC family transcriptional regulator for asnA, asnC and gidA
MSYKLDDIDRAIVQLLLEDGRMSSTEIARRMGNISERSVVSPKAVGFPVTADVFIEVEPGRIMDVAHKMAEFECVSYVACSTGAMDVSIQIVAQNNEKLYDFVTQVIAKVPGVRKTTTVLLPIVLKDVYQWSIPVDECTDPA